ncbi:Uncharacterised protein [Bordetella pertussis]|nr:Uncharacterised protein [Bordetella pertussis]
MAAVAAPNSSQPAGSPISHWASRAMTAQKAIMKRVRSQIIVRFFSAPAPVL